jgi:putative membrane protein
MADGYLWIKALHVISIIAWMAGLLYLPRLFVYHTSAAAGSPQSETFKVMEHKLLRYIMNPAMIVSFITGALLIWLLSPGVWSEGWLHGKLTLVVAMAAMHGMMAKWRRDFAEDRNTRTGRFHRWMNEVPTVLMIAIVTLVIVKPF